MIVTTLHTDIISPGQISLIKLLDKYVSDLPENSVLAITSKIVSLCENNIIKPDTITKQQLIIQQSDAYLPASNSKFGSHFTITNGLLIRAAGIDESNSGGTYVLWPKDAQQTANAVRTYLRGRFGLRNTGVVITDSTSQPLQLGTHGIALAFSGFQPLNDYTNQPDLFGRPYKYSRANIASGLAATATLAMGEGNEQTPLCLMSDVPFVTFSDADPDPAQLEAIRVPLSDDLYAPFLNAVPWKHKPPTL